MRLEKGDRVIKCKNGHRGVFLGFVNTSKTKAKCAVLWDQDASKVKHTTLSGNHSSRDQRGRADAENVSQPCKQSCMHPALDACDQQFCQDVESGHKTHLFQPHCHSCTTDVDSKFQKKMVREVESDDTKSRDAAANIVDATIKVGDLIYDRCHSDTSARPVWMVVTQSAHRGADCIAKNEHLIGEGLEPLRISLAPALVGKCGVTNKPHPRKKPECWDVKLVKDAKSVTNIFINGFRVMCRDNYHECLVSCRKYKGTLKARYCRMRLPRRPMEKTCFSQLYVPDDTVCGFVATTPNREKIFVSRPLKNIQNANHCEDYWNTHNTDVLCSPDERALVLDLARLSGKRAMNSMPELMREQLVPTLMRRLLRRLPATESLTTIDVVFRKQPFGFQLGAPSSDGYVTVAEVESGSQAAKAGVLNGMELIKIQAVSVDGRTLEEVQKTIEISEQLPDLGVQMTFRKVSLPPIQEPGVYHVKHRSAITAAFLVSHIESFLGYTHVYNDGRMAETSPIVASFLDCNTNVQLIGSVTVAMAILQYLSGYLSKNPVALCNLLSCIIAARRQCNRYKSTADDAGSKKRNAKFMAQKVIANNTGFWLIHNTKFFCR